MPFVFILEKTGSAEEISVSSAFEAILTEYLTIHDDRSRFCKILRKLCWTLMPFVYLKPERGYCTRSF